MSFLVVCIIAWTILPVLFIVGLALFLYALAVESLSRPARPPSEDTYEATPRGPASCAKRPA